MITSIYGQHRYLLGFAFFQKVLKESGILDDLEKEGIEEGDTVKMYGLQFDYYK